MIVPTPAAKTRVMPRIWLRRRKLDAKKAGSMTDTQHGAIKAAMPPRNDARIVVESKTCSMNQLQSGITRPHPNY
jgi:hypothetical protein